MNQNYEQVPNIISGKDLDYLSDMFEWNHGALKQANDSLARVQEEQIKQILKQAFQLFNSNMNIVLSILSSQGGNHE